MGEEEKKPEFKITPVKEKPKRKYRKGSKYDTIIDAFIESKSPISEVKLEKVDCNYLSTQLRKRIVARKMGNSLKVGVVNNVCYIEKVTKDK